MKWFKIPKSKHCHNYSKFHCHKRNFGLLRSFEIVFKFYIKHIIYPFCATIFHPLSETESYVSVKWVVEKCVELTRSGYVTNGATSTQYSVSEVFQMTHGSPGWIIRTLTTPFYGDLFRDHAGIPGLRLAFLSYHHIIKSTVSFGVYLQILALYLSV